MSNNSEKYKYIICPRCEIGGYDFCPDCLGAGGYTIPIEKNDFSNYEIIPNERLDIIRRKIDLIINKDVFNELIEKRLQEYSTELAEFPHDKESIEVVNRIMQINRNVKRDSIIQKIKKQLISIEEIILDFTGSNKYYITDIFFWKSLLGPNLAAFVPTDNDFFIYTSDFGFVITISNEHWIKVDKEIFIDMMKFLQSNSIFDYEATEISCNQTFIEQIKLAEYRKQLIKIRFYDVDLDIQFIMVTIKMKNIIEEYFRQIKKQKGQGWDYIEPIK